MRLIIHADDAGIDPSRNKGILDTLDFGLVKSFSVIIGQEGTQGFLREVRRRPFQCAGLHFNLTTGRPLVSGHKTLVADNGLFFSKADLLNKALHGKIDTNEVAEEFKAQIRALKEADIHLTHIDGHNHVHIFPSIREGFLAVVPEGLWVRLPREKRTKALAPRGENPRFLLNDTARLIQMLHYFSDKAQTLWKEKFRYTDDFCGTTITPRVTLTAFKNAVSGLDGELCELMCHPGSAVERGASLPFSRMNERRLEKEILTSREFKAFLEEKNIDVVSFAEV